mgnify:CR=1 FL=1
MEYKNLEEMLEKFEFEKAYTGGGCFYYERCVPESKPFSIVIFTDHTDDWLKEEANEYNTHEELMEDHRVEYDIYVCETELLDTGEDFPMYRADDVKPGHELNTDWTKLQDHIHATIELSESLVLNPEYVEKYGLTHKELLDKYRNLDVDEFKELLRIKQNFPTESYCMECGAYTDSVEIENPDCPECGE